MTYRVVAGQVLGYEPGEEFEADISPQQEARLLERGAIELLEGGQKVTDLSALTREEIDARAHEAGVANPEDLPNKQAVIDAIPQA